jgi:hypothetical protein
MTCSRISAGLATSLVACALAGCGGSSGGGGSSPSPKDAVSSYFTALGSKDWSGACDKISASSKKVIEGRAGGRKCPDALKATLGSRSLGQLKQAKTGAVRVTGDSGTVDVSAGGVSQPVKVVKEGGSWKVASDQGS